MCVCMYRTYIEHLYKLFVYIPTYFSHSFFILKKNRLKEFIYIFVAVLIKMGVSLCHLRMKILSMETKRTKYSINGMIKARKKQKERKKNSLNS